jgi:hypothetical protein
MVKLYGSFSLLFVSRRWFLSICTLDSVKGPFFVGGLCDSFILRDFFNVTRKINKTYFSYGVFLVCAIGHLGHDLFSSEI